MVVTKEFVLGSYPLHYAVWKNDWIQLSSLLSKNSEGIEQLDPRGRTPLLLAVILDHVECVKILVGYDADATFVHTSGWNTIQEAVGRGDPELLKICIEERDIQKRKKRSNLVPILLKRLDDAPDFYVEMKWEFASWVPFVTKMCPGNSHRVYKKGAILRVDSSAVGFNEPGWQNGAVTVIFKPGEDSINMLEIDHATKQVFSSTIVSNSHNGELQTIPTHVIEQSIAHWMGSPSMISSVDLEDISFERFKTGIFGWGSDKSEKVNGYDCKVFSASNFKLVTKIRTEHLSENDKLLADTKTNLERLLATFGSSSNEESSHRSQVAGAVGGAPEVSMEEYFDENFNLNGRDIGTPKEIRTKVNKFKATVWLSENYPLNLQEQLMPIIDIMALTSSHFTKLRDFILLQIPAGFPVKIEVPIFHLINASISFHNIFGNDAPVQGVTSEPDQNGKLVCVLSEELFDPPPHYDIRKSLSPTLMNSSEDDLFQWVANDEYASQASGRSRSDRVDIYEALNAPSPRAYIRENSPDEEERDLQSAIEESLMMARMCQNPSWQPASAQEPPEEGITLGDHAAAGAGARARIPTIQQSAGEGDNEDVAGVIRSQSFEELQMAIALSRREVEEAERRNREEDDTLAKVLELSMREF